MELNKQDIAERFSALSREKQKEFLAALKNGASISLFFLSYGNRRKAVACFPMRSSGTGFYGSWSR